MHVTDTLYNGVIGQWVVSKLLDTNQQQQQNTDDLRGTVPNQANAEKLVSNAQTIDQYSSNGGNMHASNGALSNIGNTTANNANNGNSMTLGASARMSLRKKLAGRNALNKRSKSATNAESDVESRHLKLYLLNFFY